jgi:3-(3-hydroxy-phenyl)propionate hydroxylase
LICPGNHRRWEISINAGEDPRTVSTPEGTWKLLAPWITPKTENSGDKPVTASTHWWLIHGVISDFFWREILRTSNHLSSGQGMCQGVRDAVNLCWRLEAVLRDGASDSLLDSYGVERKAHVTELTTRIKGIGKLITERDVEKARARDAKLLAECGGEVKPMPRQDVQPALTVGLLSPVPASCQRNHISSAAFTK